MSKTQFFFSVLALIPFGLAFVSRTAGTVAQAPVDHPIRPALTFDQYLVNLGKVDPSSQAAAWFAFTNTSDRAVKITELKPSCGCLNPRLEKKEFGPSERGEFYLRIQTANESPGAKEYYCDVLYNDGQPREARVVFKAILPDQAVIVRPPALIIYQSGANRTRHDIVISDNRDTPLRVDRVECSLDWVQLEVGPTEPSSSGAVQQTIHLSVAAVPHGQHRSMVRIFTNDNDYPELRVPLLIDSQSTPE